MKFLSNFVISNAYWIGPVLFLVYVVSVVPLNYGFNSDSGLKLLQTKALLESNFSDQGVYYPGESIDPEYKYHPYNKFLIANPAGGVWGQYPIFFSALSAPLLALFGISSLVPLCIFAYLLSIILFQRIYKPSKFVIFFALVCSPILLYALEYSENTLFLLLSSSGLFLYFKDPDMRVKPWRLFWSGLLIGTTVWLRLESFIFIPVLGISILIVRFREIGSGSFWKENLILGVGVLLPLLACLFYNYLEYGNAIGPRFVVSGKNTWEWAGKLKQLFVLLFFGYWKVGFFGYMPLLLVVFIVQFRNWSIATKRVKILLTLCILYIPLISIVVGTEAIVSWGPRYLSLAIFPSLMLMDEFYKASFQGVKNIWALTLLILLTLFSFWVTYSGFKMIRASYKQIKSVSQEIGAYKSDYVVTGSELVSGHYGRLILNTPTFLVRSRSDGEELIKRLSTLGKGRKLLFLVSLYESEDVHRRADNGQLNVFSIFKSVTPNILQYGNLSNEDNGNLISLLKRHSSLVQEEEVTDGLRSFVFVF
ncbi:LA_3751/LA_3752 family putative glycosyltransferase [Leptospira wolffii]|nr:hypothetical protein [Leptospira wolffii]